MIDACRWCSYDGDGVDVYACLACGERWGSRREPGPWCSYCGTRWTKPMVRNEPRWQRYQYTREESPPAKWIIESRFQHSDGSMSEWTREAEFASPASYALKRLREIRDRHALADEDFAPKWGQTEVRIRRERNQR